MKHSCGVLLQEVEFYSVHQCFPLILKFNLESLKTAFH